MCKSAPLRIAIAAVVVSTGVIIGAGAAAASVSLESAIAGKRDAGLAATLRRECRLTRFADYSTVYTGLSTTDILTGASLSASASHPGYSVSAIVPPEWWTDCAQGAVNLYADTVGRDLNNLAILSVSAQSEIAGMPPGEPERITADYTSWQRGTVSLYGIDVAVWSPFKSECGRLARAYLYMALMYPQRSLTPAGMMLMPDGDYRLSDYWRELLLRWTADYPPTEAEKTAALRVADAQGGVNPFVLLPGIEQYLWGDRRGEVYGQKAQESGQPIPLHGQYTRGETIYLTSPHVPGDAIWAIDGKSVAATQGGGGQILSLQASTLSEGPHRLTYTSPSTLERGCVIIVIKS